MQAEVAKLRLDTRRRDPIDRVPSLASIQAHPGWKLRRTRHLCNFENSPLSLSRPRPVARRERAELALLARIGSTESCAAFLRRLEEPEIDRFPSFLKGMMDRGLFRRGNNPRFFFPLLYPGHVFRDSTARSLKVEGKGEGEKERGRGQVNLVHTRVHRVAASRIDKAQRKLELVRSHASPPLTK